MAKTEIGSEFWEKYPPKNNSCDPRRISLLSGRTAIDYIIRDICYDGELRSVMLPSYCCESMIEPFDRKRIAVSFYDVNEHCVNYPRENDCDAVLLLDYFGYEVGTNTEIARLAHMAGKKIIYDGTHKINGNRSVERYANYSLYSYRKWYYCNDATAIKHTGEFVVEAPARFPDAYLSLRDWAADQKRAYLDGRCQNKELFRSAYGAAEEMLDRDYVGYCGVPVEADMEQIIHPRRENAAFLLEGLKEIPEICLWRPEIGLTDVPMFVPIIVDSELRNPLRQHLISKKIYCPVHWPLSARHRGSNILYTGMLSIVCDQRYTQEDMARILSEINSFFRK